MHNIFMRDRATLMEIFISNSGANRHFHNLASWYGRRYVPVDPGGGDIINVDWLYSSVADEIEKLDLSAW